MAYNDVPESNVQKMDTVMELTMQNDILSRSRNPENDTLFGGSVRTGKIDEYHPLDRSHFLRS